MANFDRQFGRTREATIQLNDVFGHVPIYSGRPLPPPDFDAELTAQVRNTHRFVDSSFTIGAWPELGDYGAVLLEQLRSYQLAEAKRLGIDLSPGGNTEHPLHPDLQALAKSLGGRAVVGIINHAPRNASHHDTGRNGDSFYAGITTSEVEIYAQLRFFRGLAARGLVKALYEIPQDNDIWPEGEQFRSSVVSQIRREPGVLERVELAKIPGLKLDDGRVAYADRFGNVRLEVAKVNEIASILVPGERVRLLVDDEELEERPIVVNNLNEIPEDRLGVYFNPADETVPDGAGYIELVRRVIDPVYAQSRHAYATLLDKATDHPETFRPSKWEDINIQIMPAA